MKCEVDRLIHYGIAGQKWGVRRFQNEDGTLTEAGKIRYGGEKKNNEGTKPGKSSSSRSHSSKDLTKKILIGLGVASLVAAGAYIAYKTRKSPKTIFDLGLPKSWPKHTTQEKLLITAGNNSVNKASTSFADKLKDEFHKKVEPLLSKEEKAAIHDYTADGYKDINHYLCKEKNGLNNYLIKTEQKIADASLNKPGVEERCRKSIELLDSALDKAHTTEDMVVNRKTSFAYIRGMFGDNMTGSQLQKILENPNEAIGRTMRSKAYLSTSIDPSANRTFGVCNLHIFVPKGSKGMYVAPLSKNEKELEFLLPRNSKFKLSEIKNFDINDESVYFSSVELFLELIG